MKEALENPLTEIEIKLTQMEDLVETLKHHRVSPAADRVSATAASVTEPARLGQIAHICERVGLEVLSMKRIRIGRVPMGKSPPRTGALFARG